MHFQIFIPRTSGAVDLESVGLGDCVTNAMGVDVNIGPDTIGPDGNPVKLGAGKCWSWTQVAAGYFGDQATWVPAVKGLAPDGKELAAGRYYLGVVKHQLPTPAELQRNPHPRHCETVRDEEGREWLIPVASRLPQILYRQPDGELDSRIHPHYQDYFERTKPFWDLLQNGGSMSYEPFWDYCLYAIRQNYRMPEELPDLLNLLTNDLMFEIPRVATGIAQVMREFEQAQTPEDPPKNQPPGS